MECVKYINLPLEKKGVILSTMLSSQYNLGESTIRQDPEKDEKKKNTLSFKGIGLDYLSK